VPVEFLSDDETAAYGRFVGVPSRADLDRAFFLDDADKALVRKRRGDPPPRSRCCWKPPAGTIR
jgi:hypothetical protein